MQSHIDNRFGRVQIVVLGLLCLMLMVLTCLLWQSKSAAEQARDHFSAKATELEKQVLEARKRLVVVQGRVMTEPLEWVDFLGAIEKDISEFGVGMPNETYQDLLIRLNNRLDLTRRELSSIKGDYSELQTDYAALEAVNNAKLEASVASARDARSELRDIQAQFVRDLEEKDSEIRAVMDRATTLANRLETEVRGKQQIEEQLLSEVNQLKILLAAARPEPGINQLIDRSSDGEVVRASIATRSVWLNIGSSHGVKERLTFTIQPSEYAGDPFESPKAKVQILSVIGPHLSEAKILEQGDIRHPIIKGDKIFNSIWSPGQTTRFALMGRIDLDGDGIEDRKLAHEIIRNAGGRVEAELLPDGSQIGRVSVRVDYLVRGDNPSFKEIGMKHKDMVAQMAKMQKDARDFGAVTVDVTKFMNLVGYTHVNRLTSETVTPYSPQRGYQIRSDR